MGDLLNLKTDSALLASLREAKSKTMTEEEIREQRVSFVYSSMGDKSDISRERIKEILDQQEGRTRKTA